MVTAVMKRVPSFQIRILPSSVSLRDVLSLIFVLWMSKIVIKSTMTPVLSSTEVSLTHFTWACLKSIRCMNGTILHHRAHVDISISVSFPRRICGDLLDLSRTRACSICVQLGSLSADSNLPTLMNSNSKDTSVLSVCTRTNSARPPLLLRWQC